MSKVYDVVIIGAGPAGISAALYAKRANKNVLVIYNGESNLEKAEKIDNYYGFENGITGKELYEAGIRQAKRDANGVQTLAITKKIGMRKLEKVEEITEDIKTQLPSELPVRGK